MAGPRGQRGGGSGSDAMVIAAAPGGGPWGQSRHGPRGQVGVAAAHRGRRIGIILCIHAKAKANSDCCPRGQSHCVALCPGIMRVDKQSAGIKAEA